VTERKLIERKLIERGRRDAAFRPVETKPAMKAPPRVARAGAHILAHLARKTRFADPALIARWPALVGADMASLCRPGRLSGGARDRTLTLHVSDGAAAASVEFAAGDLLARLEGYFGPGVVGRVKIVQSGGEAAAPARTGLSRFRKG